MKRLLITTGDPDGIGSEVTAKALAELGPQRGIQFVLYRAPNCPEKHLRLIDRNFSRLTLTGGEAFPSRMSSMEIIDVVRKDPPARWVEDATRFCLAKKTAGLITGPLSKTGIHAAGLKDRGHTEIFKRLCRTQDLFMAFVGHAFNVLLLTDHIPLKSVGAALTHRRVEKGLNAAKHFQKILRDGKPIAFVGVNPHAGESGLLGKEELRLQRALRRRRVVGPLVPDAAFLPMNWKKFSIFVCPYHDQGLIPFKMVHGFDGGVHLTLGLPFVRTSVDHGTAKKLFGRGVAQHGSMRDAIRLATELVRGK